MVASVLAVTVPALVFFTTALVGLQLTGADFRRAVREPRLIAAALLGQCVLMPALAVALIALIGPPPYCARGLLRVSVCPAGPLANFFNLLARGHVALSVTLTGLSCLTAVLTLPLSVAALGPRLGEAEALAVPAPLLAG